MTAKKDKKVILITGASRGIGRAAAEKLAEKHKVVLTARDIELLNDVRTKIESRGGEALSVMADITRESEVREMIEIVHELYGRIDVLINNAGIGLFRRIDDITPEEFDAVYRVNMFGAFLITHLVVPEMIRRKSGQIINIASVAGLNGFKYGTAYAASKFALVGFSESLREDLKSFGIAVTVLCPGSVRTTFGGKEEPGDPASGGGYMLEADDVAATINYLVEESETANAKMIELKPRRRVEFRGE